MLAQRCALSRNLLCSLSSGCAPICVFLSDFVTVTLSLRFGNVTVTARDFTFYDCTAVKQLSGSQPWVIADDLSAVLSVCLLLICAVHADPLIESHSPSESVLFCLVPGSLFVPPSVHLAPFVIISVSVFPPTHCPLFNSPVQACDPGFCQVRLAYLAIGKFYWNYWVVQVEMTSENNRVTTTIRYQNNASMSSGS